jgi:hypothetical protein
VLACQRAQLGGGQQPSRPPEDVREREQPRARAELRGERLDGVLPADDRRAADDDAGAAREIARVIEPGGKCVATVPALRSLWSASDDYYEHRRRYSRRTLGDIFRRAGFSVRKLSFWGFPVVLLYDTLFLLPMNRRRARRDVQSDGALRSVARAGRSRILVRMVRALFAVDRMFSWIPFGPGLIVVATKE